MKPRKRHQPRRHRRQSATPPASEENPKPAPEPHYFTSIDLAAPGSTDWSSEAPIHWQNSSCPKPSLCLCLILTAAAIFIFLFIFLLTSA